MKKILSIAILSLSIVGASTTFTSCDMDSETKSSSDMSSVFSSFDLANTAVLGICQSFGETNSYRGRFLPYYGLNTDIEQMNYPQVSKGGDDAKYDLTQYAASPTNTQMNTSNNAYAKFYEGIERANLAIEGLEQYGDIDNNANMGQLYAEAITLRSVLYLDLIKGWGDVPYRFSSITSSTTYLPRTDRDSIYTRLLSDLKTAETYAPWPTTTSQVTTTERVSKAFVKGLRARIALYAAGYSQRADGTVRLSDTSKFPELTQTNLYNIVKDECLDIINSGYNKLGGFQENFVKLCKDKITAGGESLYEIPFSDGRGRVLYTYGIKHNGKDQYTQQAQGGVNGPTATLYYDYDVDDSRRDVTCAPYDWAKPSNGVAQQELRSSYKWCFGKYRYEWMDRTVTSTNDDGVNWQYMRLADVYLMAAEVVNHLDGPSAAWTYMAPVLNRVLPAAKVSALKTTYTASQSAFQAGIEDQRKFEFAGEMLRKADLIRWNKLGSALAAEKTKITQLRNREGDYADLPDNLYYKIDTNAKTVDGQQWYAANEGLIIYGLNHGETDAEGKQLETDEGYSSTSWLITDDTHNNLVDDYINGLYTQDPDKHQYWPIWQNFIDSSNNMLNNSWLGY